MSWPYLAKQEDKVMPIKVHMLPLGMLQTNCFIVADDETLEAIVIDPADQASQILQLIESENYVVKEVLATHGHFDHVLAARPLCEATNAPFRIHKRDVPHLQRSQQIAQGYGISASIPMEPDSGIESGDVFEAGNIRLETRFTPGHSPGHVSFVLASENVVFSGDCLFSGGIGRVDLPGGDYATLMTSIERELLPLGDDFTVCCGHGPTTTIGRERVMNGYVLQWLERGND
jgi:glyoxylase-like metal-dependent hydrolase (beta-lactamase superfamily II)